MKAVVKICFNTFSTHYWSQLAEILVLYCVISRCGLVRIKRQIQIVEQLLHGQTHGLVRIRWQIKVVCNSKQLWKHSWSIPCFDCAISLVMHYPYQNNCVYITVHTFSVCSHNVRKCIETMAKSSGKDIKFAR